MSYTLKNNIVQPKHKKFLFVNHASVKLKKSKIKNKIKFNE